MALNRTGAFAGSLLVICWRTIHGQTNLPGARFMKLSGVAITAGVG